MALLSLVTSANVACGYHAGTRVTMRAVCAEAARLGVAVGAQVSYDDREHFGRLARDVAADLLTEQVADQVGTLTEIAVSEGTLGVVPEAARRAVPPGPRRRGAGGGGAGRVRPPARARPARCAASTWPPTAGRATYREGFADRAYRGDRLVPRDEPGALIEDVDAIAAQAVDLAPSGRLDLRARRQPRGGRRGPSRTAGAHRRRRSSWWPRGERAAGRRRPGPGGAGGRAARRRAGVHDLHPRSAPPAQRRGGARGRGRACGRSASCPRPSASCGACPPSA